MSVNIGSAKSVLSETFIKDADEISEDGAMEAIVKASIEIKDLEEEKDNDDQLNAAKVIVKDLNSGYTAAIRHNKAKIRHLIGKIEEIQEGVNPHASY